MANFSNQTQKTVALLDRLIDQEPDLSYDPPQTAAQQSTDLRNALRRDLELLLNTRCNPTTPPNSLREVQNSLMCFGVGDFFSSQFVTDQQRHAFTKDLKQRILRFEPRLENLSVSLHQERTPTRRSLHLRISADYCAEAGLPPIVFETRVDPIAGHFTIVEGGRG